MGSFSIWHWLVVGILVLLPIFVIYIFLQRWIVDGATQSAFK